MLAAIANPDFPAIARATMLTLLGPPPGDDEISAVQDGFSDEDRLIRIAALRIFRQFPAEIRLQPDGKLLDDPVRGVRLEAALAYADVRDLLSTNANRAFSRAADEYRQALLATANCPGFTTNLAEFESMTGNTSAAARYFEQAIALDPEIAVVHHAYGLLLARIDRGR